MDDLSHIVAACKRNHRDAQALLYGRLAPTLMGICLRYMQHREEAEDLLQDCFVKIFTSLPAFRDEGSFEGWAKRITVNMAINALKKKKRITFTSDLSSVEDEASGGNDPELPSAGELMSCLSALPHGYRTIINLFLVEEFSHREIAEKLGIAESTSRSQYSRAIRALSEAIKKKQPETATSNI